MKSPLHDGQSWIRMKKDIAVYAPCNRYKGTHPRCDTSSSYFQMNIDYVNADNKRFVIQVKNALVDGTLVPVANEDLGILSGYRGIHLSDESWKKRN